MISMYLLLFCCVQCTVLILFKTHRLHYRKHTDVNMYSVLLPLAEMYAKNLELIVILTISIAVMSIVMALIRKITWISCLFVVLWCFIFMYYLFFLMLAIADGASNINNKAQKCN